MTQRRLLLIVLPTFTSVLLAQAQPRDAANIEYVRIAAGEFMMGCSDGDADCNPDENPRHRVRITRAFDLGKYELTQKQWLSVMPNNPSANKGDNRPIENISKFEALDFIAALNAKNDGYRYRLPTEAEWEYAARAGTSAPHATPLEQVAWFADNSDDESHPVGQKMPNAWGLYDMQGNVREWVSDLYNETFYGTSPVADPTGPAPCANGFADPSTVGRGFQGGPPDGGPPPGSVGPGGPGGPGQRGAGGAPPPTGLLPGICNSRLTICDARCRTCSSSCSSYGTICRRDDAEVDREGRVDLEPLQDLAGRALVVDAGSAAPACASPDRMAAADSFRSSIRSMVCRRASPWLAVAGGINRAPTCGSRRGSRTTVRRSD